MELAVAAAHLPWRRPLRRDDFAAGGVFASAFRTRHAGDRPAGDEMRAEIGIRTGRTWMRRRVTVLAAATIAALAASPASAFMVYVSNEKDNTISVVDSDTMQVVKTVNVGQRPRGITISHDGKFI